LVIIIEYFSPDSEVPTGNIVIFIPYSHRAEGAALHHPGIFAWLLLPLAKK